MVFYGYVFAIVPTGRDEANLITGRKSGPVLEDVHFYPLASASQEPWVLDDVLVRFLEEKHELGFEPLPNSIPINPQLAPLLVPLPIVQLERLYRGWLRSRG
jgi:hypothetical protein